MMLGVKACDNESEEADGCKMTYRPDRKVLGECEKNSSPGHCSPGSHM